MSTTPSITSNAMATPSRQQRPAQQQQTNDSRPQRYAHAFVPSLQTSANNHTNAPSQDLYMDEKRALALAQSDPLPGPSRLQTQQIPLRPPRTSSLSHLSVSTSMPTPGLNPPARRLLLHSHLHSCRHSMTHSLPFVFYVVTSLMVLAALTCYRKEVFGALDELAVWLREQGTEGMLVLAGLIFLGCIPPIPLYSTLQILSGYTFGAFTGTLISYFSALVGATVVFLLCRHIPALHGPISSSLHHLPPLRRVVRAIARKPKLLFLVRLAPYPYNVLNALLAAAPALTTRTYVTCTALSLVKVGIHTSVGAGIRSFAEYHNASGNAESDSSKKAADEQSAWLGQVSSAAGVVLCVVIAIYLSYVARRAVDEELEDADSDPSCPASSSPTLDGPESFEPSRTRTRRDRERYTGTNEERAAFLSANELEYEDGVGDEMSEVSSAPYPPSRPLTAGAPYPPAPTQAPSRPPRSVFVPAQDSFSRAGFEEATIGLY